MLAKIRKVFAFIGWSVRGLKTWQWVYMASAFFFGAGIAENDEQVRSVLFTIAGGIAAFWFMRYLVWEAIEHSWQRYNREQEELVEILKKDHGSSSVPK